MCGELYDSSTCPLRTFPHLLSECLKLSPKPQERLRLSLRATFRAVHTCSKARVLRSCDSSPNHVLVAQSCPTRDLWTVAHQAPLSMGFSRQEY